MSWNRSLLLLYLESMQWAKPFTQHLSRKGWKGFSTNIISDTIKRNNMFTFANRHDPKRKGKKDNCTPKQNMTLITQLFLSLQSRSDADMIDFFRFENQREPPSLADQGSLRAGTKSDVLECLSAPTSRESGATQAAVVVLDMAAVIHMVRPTTAKTYNEYVSLNIIPFLKNTTQRIDAVWNNYQEENNLKALTQQRRENGPRTRVGNGSTPIPKRKWNSAFLKNVENKKELFSFISTQISKIDMDGKLLLGTHFETVSIEIVTLQHSSHATIPRQTPGSTCIWHMPYNRVIQQPMFARWTATSWY